jgi:hypothetical protein
MEKAWNESMTARLGFKDLKFVDNPARLKVTLSP